MEEKIINYNELKFEILNEKPKIVIALKSKKNFSRDILIDYLSSFFDPERLQKLNTGLLGSISLVVEYLKRNKNLSKKLIHEIVCECLAEVGLFNVENKLPNELSGGMQKRVSFARALITDQTLNAKSKPLLLFDEPTAGLDPIASSRIEDLINKTNDKASGSSIVVSHVLSTIERTSDKVLMLYGGKFRWAGSIDEFKKSKDPYVFQFRNGKLDGPMQPKDI